MTLIVSGVFPWTNLEIYGETTVDTAHFAVAVYMLTWLFNIDAFLTMIILKVRAWKMKKMEFSNYSFNMDISVNIAYP